MTLTCGSMRSVRRSARHFLQLAEVTSAPDQQARSHDDIACHEVAQRGKDDRSDVLAVLLDAAAEDRRREPRRALLHDVVEPEIGVRENSQEADVRRL